MAVTPITDQAQKDELEKAFANQGKVAAPTQEPTNNNNSWLGGMKDSFTSALNTTAAGLNTFTAAVEDQTGIQLSSDNSRYRRQLAERQRKEAEKYKPTVQKIEDLNSWENLGRFVTETAAALPVVAAETVFAPVGAASRAANIYEQQAPEDKSVLRAGLTGAATVALDKIGLDRIFKGAGKTSTQATDLVPKQGIVGKTVGAVDDVAGATLVEGSTELAQHGLETYGRQGDLENVQEGAIDRALLGGVAGGALRTAAKTYQGAADIATALKTKGANEILTEQFKVSEKFGKPHNKAIGLQNKAAAAMGELELAQQQRKAAKTTEEIAAANERIANANKQVGAPGLISGLQKLQKNGIPLDPRALDFNYYDSLETADREPAGKAYELYGLSDKDVRGYEFNQNMEEAGFWSGTFAKETPERRNELIQQGGTRTLSDMAGPFKDYSMKYHLRERELEAYRDEQMKAGNLTPEQNAEYKTKVRDLGLLSKDLNAIHTAMTSDANNRSTIYSSITGLMNKVGEDMRVLDPQFDPQDFNPSLAAAEYINTHKALFAMYPNFRFGSPDASISAPKMLTKGAIGGSAILSGGTSLAITELVGGLGKLKSARSRKKVTDAIAAANEAMEAQKLLAAAKVGDPVIDPDDPNTPPTGGEGEPVETFTQETLGKAQIEAEANLEQAIEDLEAVAVEVAPEMGLVAGDIDARAMTAQRAADQAPAPEAAPEVTPVQPDLSLTQNITATSPEATIEAVAETSLEAEPTVEPEATVEPEQRQPDLNASRELTPAMISARDKVTEAAAEVQEVVEEITRLNPDPTMIPSSKVYQRAMAKLETAQAEAVTAEVPQEVINEAVAAANPDLTMVPQMDRPQPEQATEALEDAEPVVEAPESRPAPDLTFVQNLSPEGLAAKTKVEEAAEELNEIVANAQTAQVISDLEAAADPEVETPARVAPDLSVVMGDPEVRARVAALSEAASNAQAEGMSLEQVEAITQSVSAPDSFLANMGGQQLRGEAEVETPVADTVVEPVAEVTPEVEAEPAPYVAPDLTFTQNFSPTQKAAQAELEVAVENLAEVVEAKAEVEVQAAEAEQRQPDMAIVLNDPDVRARVAAADKAKAQVVGTEIPVEQADVIIESKVAPDTQFASLAGSLLGTRPVEVEVEPATAEIAEALDGELDAEAEQILAESPEVASSMQIMSDSLRDLAAMANPLKAARDRLSQAAVRNQMAPTQAELDARANMEEEEIISTPTTPAYNTSATDLIPPVQRKTVEQEADEALANPNNAPAWLSLAAQAEATGWERSLGKLKAQVVDYATKKGLDESDVEIMELIEGLNPSNSSQFKKAIDGIKAARGRVANERAESALDAEQSAESTANKTVADAQWKAIDSLAAKYQASKALVTDLKATYGTETPLTRSQQIKIHKQVIDSGNKARTATEAEALAQTEVGKQQTALREAGEKAGIDPDIVEAVLDGEFGALLAPLTPAQLRSSWKEMNRRQVKKHKDEAAAAEREAKKIIADQKAEEVQAEKDAKAEADEENARYQQRLAEMKDRAAREKADIADQKAAAEQAWKMRQNRAKYEAEVDKKKQDADAKEQKAAYERKLAELKSRAEREQADIDAAKKGAEESFKMAQNKANYDAKVENARYQQELQRLDARAKREREAIAAAEKAAKETFDMTQNRAKFEAKAENDRYQKRMAELQNRTERAESDYRENVAQAEETFRMDNNRRKQEAASRKRASEKKAKEVEKAAADLEAKAAEANKAAKAAEAQSAQMDSVVNKLAEQATMFEGLAAKIESDNAALADQVSEIKNRTNEIVANQIKTDKEANEFVKSLEDKMQTANAEQMKSIESLIKKLKNKGRKLDQDSEKFANAVHAFNKVAKRIKSRKAAGHDQVVDLPMGAGRSNGVYTAKDRQDLQEFMGSSANTAYAGNMNKIMYAEAFGHDNTSMPLFATLDDYKKAKKNQGTTSAVQSVMSPQPEPTPTAEQEVAAEPEAQAQPSPNYADPVLMQAMTTHRGARMDRPTKSMDALNKELDKTTSVSANQLKVFKKDYPHITNSQLGKIQVRAVALTDSFAKGKFDEGESVTPKEYWNKMDEVMRILADDIPPSDPEPTTKQKRETEKAEEKTDAPEVVRADKISKSTSFESVMSELKEISEEEGVRPRNAPLHPRQIKNFAGSYTYEGMPELKVESFGQWSTEKNSDEGGNKWVLSVSTDFNGDKTGFFRTKKEADEAAEREYRILKEEDGGMSYQEQSDAQWNDRGTDHIKDTPYRKLKSHQKFTYVTQVAETYDPKWSRQDRIAFQRFNPNGLYAKIGEMNNKISDMIDNGELRSGWALAYGSLSGADTRFQDYFGDKKRHSEQDLRLAMQMAEDHLARVQERLDAHAETGEGAPGYNKETGKIEDVQTESASGSTGLTGILSEATPETTSQKVLTPEEVTAKIEEAGNWKNWADTKFDGHGTTFRLQEDKVRGSKAFNEGVQEYKNSNVTETDPQKIAAEAAEAGRAKVTVLAEIIKAEKEAAKKAKKTKEPAEELVLPSNTKELLLTKAGNAKDWKRISESRAGKELIENNKKTLIGAFSDLPANTVNAEYEYAREVVSNKARNGEEPQSIQDILLQANRSLTNIRNNNTRIENAKLAEKGAVAEGEMKALDAQTSAQDVQDAIESGILYGEMDASDSKAERQAKKDLERAPRKKTNQPMTEEEVDSEIEKGGEFVVVNGKGQPIAVSKNEKAAEVRAEKANGEVMDIATYTKAIKAGAIVFGLFGGSAASASVFDEYDEETVANMVALGQQEMTQEFYDRKGFSEKVRQAAVGVKEYEDYNKKLGFKESSNNYKAENRLGYIGKYQWGAAALKDLGYIKKNAKGSQKQILNNPANWTGKNGVRSKQEFLNYPAEQDTAIHAWNKILDKRMKGSGLEKYIGRTMDGVKITKDGIRAASHLLGTQAVRRELAKGTLTGSSDANGTTIKKYMLAMG